METTKNYHDQINALNILKLRELLKELPPFCKQYFRGIENETSTRTRIAYAMDLKIFFEFLKETNSILGKIEITSYPVSLLDDLRRDVECCHR